MSKLPFAVPPPSGRYESLVEAVDAGGGTVVPVAEARSLVWADAARPDLLPDALADAPHLEWVQLPLAGIENYVHLLDADRTWTCGKGVYAPPVAEHALAMTLAGLRHLVGYARETRWSGPVGRNLLGADVVVLGGGEITVELLRLLGPFGVTSTVVRKHPDPVPGATRTVGVDRLDEVLPAADVVVLALALTPETEGILNARTLALLPDHAWVVNVARGRHIVTDDLVAALEAGRLGGAALDVTDPEPLPDGHPLWSAPGVLVVPHVGGASPASYPRMGRYLHRQLTAYRDTGDLQHVVHG